MPEPGSGIAFIQANKNQNQKRCGPKLKKFHPGALPLKPFCFHPGALPLFDSSGGFAPF